MTNPTETARALLYRHGLPEDVIDGALCLHAQELAAAIREETQRLKTDGVLEPWKYRPCRDAANQIDPTRNEDDVDRAEAALAPLEAKVRAGREAQQTGDRAALRDRIADAVRDVQLRIDPMTRILVAQGEPIILSRDEADAVADVVLAVLPEPTDQAAVCAAALREAADRLWALADRTTERGAGVLWVADWLRRLADEQPTTPTEAHPPEHRWAAELYDPTADEWVPGTRFPARERAVAALEHGRRIGATWKDGTPTQRRLVRETKTYTVEPAPAGPAAPTKETEGRCPACGHTVCDGDGPCGARSGNDFCICTGAAPAKEA